MFLNFYLVNLVLFEREKNIENIFKKYIGESERRKFLRITWKDIFRYISNINSSRDKDIILNYFKNKTIGYDRRGKLQIAFSIKLHN